MKIRNLSFTLLKYLNSLKVFVKVYCDTIQNDILSVYISVIQILNNYPMNILKDFFTKLFKKAPKGLPKPTGLKSYNDEYEKWLGV